MKRIYPAVLVAAFIIAGCATSPVVKDSGEVKKVEPAAEVKKEPVKVVTTVYYPVKETSLYADGSLDEYTVYTYDEKGEKLLKKELFDSDNVLQEREEYEYTGDLPMVKKFFDKNSDLQNYHTYEYDGAGNMVSDSTYNPKDELQSQSKYSWDGNKKVKWSVFDASGALFGTTEYIYEGDLNTKIVNRNSAGEEEESFVIEYNGSGLPVKNTEFTADGTVLGSRTFEYKDGLLVLEKVLRSNGSVKRKIVYSNDEAGNPLEIIYTDSADNVQERIKKEYKSREVVSYITEK